MAIKLASPEKEGLFKYVKDSSGKDVLTNLEQLFYVTNSLPGTVQSSKFKLEIGSSSKVITLNNYETFDITLTKEKLSQIKFTEITGDIAVAARFTGDAKDTLAQNTELVTLKRSYSVKNVVKNSFNQSDLIKITLTPKFNEACPDGFYEVTDILPCGLRYVQGKHDSNENWYPDEVSGQKVVFGFYYDKNDPNGAKNIIYYARAVSPGKFTADNTLIKHSESDAAGFAQKSSVKVGK